jgi:hypothetical protein
MAETRIKISSVVENQLPEFVKDEFPLVSEFLKQYYLSLESQGSTYDLISNLDQYVKVDNLSNLIDSTTLTSKVSFFDTTINVSSTAGFPNSYGLLLIDSEVITYTRKTATSFIGCIRGFSGTTSLDNSSNPDELVFTDSAVQEHSSSATVKNLSILFLQKFFTKLKTQVTPGFEDRTLFSGLNDGLFIKQAADFYSSKGTEGSFEILFRALYGKDVTVIRPQDYLIQPSDAHYRVTRDLVVENINGNINQLVNRTVYQDESSFLAKARGTVTQVERIQRANKDYYVLSLDIGYQRDIDVDGTIFGEFSIHPKTLCITSIKDVDSSVGGFTPSSTSLDVDSTVGFPQSGKLIVDLENGSQITITYTDKTLTQFLNCSGITQEIPSGTEIKSNFYAYGYDDSQQIVKFRVTGVLSDIELQNQNSSFSAGDPIKIKTLGDEIEEYKFNNWFFNVSTSYTTKSVELLDSSNNSYALNFYDEHSFVIGDRVSILPSFGRPGTEVFGTVISYRNKRSITVSGQGSLNSNQVYDVTKILSRFDSSNYPTLSKYTTNVQNVYADDEKSLYVASPSLPTYLNQKVTVNDRSVTFSGTFSGNNLTIQNHPFYTGDAVYYRSNGTGNNLGIPDGFYFVKKINSSTIQLSKSRANLYANKIVSVSGTVSNNKLEFSSFVSDSTLKTKQLEPQKLIRKVSTPVDDENQFQTLPGSTGILVNGVELLNYKSSSNIFYGPIEEITVTSPGSGYDIINPPVLQISDAVGSGATAYCNVKGNLDRIDVVDGGFDYLEEPKITISGGNGSLAEAKANLISFDHYVTFNASPTSGAINATTGQISFISDHKFRDYEQVVYDPQGQKVVGGLSTNSSYFVSVIDSTSIKLHSTYSDSILGVNTVSVANNGIGIQRFKSSNKKRKIGSITVTNPGSGYENKKRTSTVSGINTASNIINIQNHGYQNAEVLTYNFTESSVVGLSSTSTYYVTKVDDDNFKLSLVGTSTTQPININYVTKNYVDLIGAGGGIHIFNYEPITVTASGSIGVSTLTGQNFNAVLQPVFRGSIESVHVQNGGNNFGSDDILNYNRQPEFLLLNGSGSQLTPVINNGSIVDVIINDPGINYNSAPNIIVHGSGSGALLTPIVSNGTITSVNVVFGGIGYLDSDTSLEVIPAGQSAKFECSIKSWNINLFERFLQTNQITNDDGILEDSFSGFGIQYFHLYSPRKLRSSVLATRYKDGQIFYQPDLQIVNGREVVSNAHSPIIGWAYDGNPIYGPYGYSSITGGSVRSMVSGYQLKLKPNRPSTTLYPAGFFVDDYEFIGNGDLDENNGRFCVTPEYPNGVYAYFTTINSGDVESVGVFRNYKLPVFPYFIGNTYKSKPEGFNFLKSSNQSDIDINQTNWLRNTTPYNITKSNSGYQFLYNPNKIREQISHVKSVSSGTISSVGILTGGRGYQVNDKVIFKDTDLSSKKPVASVSFVKGKTVSSVSVATSELSNLEFYPSGNGYVAFSTTPHYFNNRDIVTFTSDFENSQTETISNSINSLVVSTGIGSTVYTGLVTYFNVIGNLSETFIKENDIYQILNERVKILNIDAPSSRVRVLRNIGETTGISTYSVGVAITEVTRKLYIDLNIQNDYDYKLNKELYFNPSESLGIGTTSGPGVATTLTFSNPGVGATQISIPTRSIYIPNHQLTSGDELIYSSNGGNQISISTDGISSYQLSENSVVYATRLTSDLIGISSYRVGLGTTGYYAGISTSANLLYFTNLGSGEIHSFTTNYQSILIGNISKNEATVSTASTHGLKLGDSVIVNVISGISTQISVSYDDYNRRAVINKLNFLASAVDIARNTITIPNHGLYTSQKVIYTSTAPSGGLSNEGIYYVIVVDKNTIKLSNNYYYSSRVERNEVNITSSSDGSISSINPSINLTNKNTLIFDVSSPTLSFLNSGILYSAFDLDFYTDSNFKFPFEFTNSSNVEIIKTGRVGIDTNATVTLKVNDSTPRKLYYKLTPTNLEIIPTVKEEIIVDDEIIDNSSINIKESIYSGNQVISGIASTAFTYLLSSTPERSSYNQENSSISYITNSTSAYGEIESISTNYGGLNLKSIPEIIDVSSKFGSGEVLELSTDSIGKVIKTTIDDIGFGYSNDYSVRPTAKLPDVIKVTPQASFKSIGIASVGKGYSIAPDLVVLDGLANKVVSDVDLRYNLDSKTVTILKNTKSINNVTPIIIPVNNNNGVGISSIRFIPSSKDVVVTLGSSFSNVSDFPFNVGDKVLIENTSVGVGSTGKGYNSSNYNYTLFTVVNTDPNIGGVGATVSYNISNYLSDGEVPGTFNVANSSGRIIPQKHFPIFNVVLEKNTFNKGETVFSNESSGTVVDWNEITETLKVSTNNTFSVGELITGRTSTSSGLIGNITISRSNYVVGSASTVVKGWQTETGFLDNQFQRVHDNDYYQYFSYSLKSQISVDTWNDAVSNLNHTAGFKRFSDLVVESSPVISGINTEQNLGDVSGIADLSRSIDLNCVYDFDLVTENNFIVDGSSRSDEILFGSRVLQDYIESVGNRVLLIDDISDEFNSNPRSTQFSIVDTFRLDSRSVKYLTFVKDRRFTSQKQVSIVSLVHDGSTAYINQYGGVDTYYDMGSFDFSITGLDGHLLFYPTKSTINDYDVSTISFDIRDSITSIGSTNLGDTVFVGSATTNIPSGTSSAITIVGIASTYRSSKVLVQIGATNSSYHQFEEFTVLHDGTNIILQEYGQLNTVHLESDSTLGLGTYHAYYSGSNINIDLIPYTTTSIQYNVNSARVSISSTLSVGVGTEVFNDARIQSSYIAISSTPTPGITTVASYSSTYEGCYYIVSAEDLTNNQYQVSEVIVVDADNEAYITEFGIIQTGSSIGLIGATVNSSGNVDLTFTANANTDVQVRVYQNPIGLVNSSIANRTIDFTNAFIRTGYGFYTGSETDVKRAFGLTHKQKPIFERYFDGSNSDIVSVTNNTITIPEHFFITGEKVIYSFAGAGTTQAIGIATTTISGVGSTDKLPSSLYIVKESDLKVRVAASASDALRNPPNVLDITTVGIGTSHRFVSTNQNARVLIGIDNLIQSPIVATSVTTTASKEVSIVDDRLTFSGITSFFGGDLVKVDDEIMRVDSVGFGSTNVVLIQRAWMGTGIATHAVNSTITKVNGDFNIVGNTINFVTAPYGPTPIGSTTNPPDSRDFVGVETHSTFSGRSFIRSGILNGDSEPYSHNYIFDDISSGFNGTNNTFTLKSNRSNISGFSTSNAIILINDIFQGPARVGAIQIVGDYDLSENTGITSITFTGSISSTSYDINTSNLPLGGVIVSVGSTSGLGYQPLVSAGGTATVSIAGTISLISIGNSGSGYRSGIQTVNVGVATSSTGIPNITYIGIATVVNGHVTGVAITNPGTGYTTTNPPIVIFDDPLSYSNIPLVYSSSSSGLGTAATADIVVGQGSSVISFEIRNTGYGYGQGQVLTVAIGGTTGIPTDTSVSFREFQIIVEETFTDEFTGWTIGDLQVIDPIDSLFDGEKTTFPIKINGEQTTIRSRRGSNIEVKANLLIFINDILQVPDVSYIFNGGSIITFKEAPKVGDTSKILFYRGTGDVDTINVDLLETVKEGDTLRIDSDIARFKEDTRLVTDVVSTDVVETNVYPGPGLTQDETFARPVVWCRQTEDKIINGQEVGKDRILYEPLITPTSNIIQNISVASTQIFVESVKTFFDSADEYLQNGTSEAPQKKVIIISQDQLVAAAATAIVSVGGTISSIVISDGGVGYSTNPVVIIENPVGLGTTQRATATSTISVGGTVSSIAVSNPGAGYTTSNSPVVLIAPPDISREVIDVVSYDGDFGIISGIKTTSVGVASTGIVFDLFIPKNSFLRDTTINSVGIATTGVSGIQTGYYFMIFNSNIGFGLTSLTQSGSVVGVGTSFIDNVYEVASVSIGQTDVVGVGLTYVAKVTVSVSNYNGLSGLGYSNFYGEYSWGRLHNLTRNDAKAFTYYNNGLVGISTSAKVQRYNPLKYRNYVS